MPAAAIRKGVGGHVAAGRSFLLSDQLHDCCMDVRPAAEAQREPRLVQPRGRVERAAAAQQLA